MQNSGCEANARIISDAIGSLEDHLSSRSYRDFWDLVKEINVLFKTLKPLSSNDRERLWDSFSLLCDDAKNQQKNFRVRSEHLMDEILSDIANAQPLSFALSHGELRNSLKDLGVILNDANRKFSDHKREMIAEHKKACFEALQSMRERHNECWDRVKENQTNRRRQSEYLRNDILSDIENARPCELAILPGGIGFVDTDEMKAMSRLLKNAGDRLHNHKEEMFGEHKQECFHAIQEMRKTHDIWWEELRRRLDEHHEHKRSGIRERITTNLESNRERLCTAKSNLTKMRASASDLQDKIFSAWNDDYRERAEGWLSDLEDKIENVEEYINRILEWIAEDETKLSNL
jgi:gas vesicle protein/DNA-binding transcriptional MerR regulator